MVDAELLAAAAAGNADAFAVFYRRHLERVLGFGLRATGDPELAGDLAGEVFAAALEACARYRPLHASALPWLLGIAQNKLRESRRRGRVQDATRRRLAIVALPLEEHDLVRIQTAADVEHAEVIAAVEALPEAERLAVRARVVDGREYREIAAELECSEMVVRQRVSRGLRRARSRLSGTEAEDRG
jgi:RNA polymerase sigma factor (sigma-70 family)